MTTSQFRRIGEIEIGTDRQESEDCARITSLIRNHGWDLYEIVLHARNGSTVKAATLTHQDPEAQPADFGWLIDEPLTRPSQ